MKQRLLVEVCNGYNVSTTDTFLNPNNVSNELIIRETGAAKDTFLVSTSELEYGVTQNTGTGAKIIETLEMSITYNEVLSRMRFHKQYAADLIMQLETDKDVH